MWNNGRKKARQSKTQPGIAIHKTHIKICVFALIAAFPPYGEYAFFDKKENNRE
ncbi:hypothetical protein FACS18949_04310 [Clostridia bacterium]|nr:hypothetical protein FACS18949_04310 [Clostridia bacterium]